MPGKTKKISASKNIKKSLKNNNQLIIHISGASGSGKTTLGNKLKEIFQDTIIIKDLDDLLFEFVKNQENNNISTNLVIKNWKKNYQKHINNFINNQNKPIVFVGLNTDLGSLGFRNTKITPPKTIYDIKAKHKFYIDLPIEQILKQKFSRQIQKICDQKEKWFSKWLENPQKTQNKLNYDVNLLLWQNETNNWNNLYKKLGYKFLSREDILLDIKKILS